MLFNKPYSDTYSHNPSLVKKYMYLCSFPLHQLIIEPKRIKDHNNLLIDHHILTNSPGKDL